MPYIGSYSSSSKSEPFEICFSISTSSTELTTSATGILLSTGRILFCFLQAYFRKIKNNTPSTIMTRISKVVVERFVEVDIEVLEEVDVEVLEEVLVEVLVEVDVDVLVEVDVEVLEEVDVCLLYTSPSPRDRQKSRMPSSA